MTDKEEKTWCNVGLRFHWIMEEKIDKYIDFAAEVRRQFMVKTVTVPVVLGALVTIPEKLSGPIEKMKIEKEIGRFQNRYIYIYIYIYMWLITNIVFSMFFFICLTLFDNSMEFLLS